MSKKRRKRSSRRRPPPRPSSRRRGFWARLHPMWILMGGALVVLAFGVWQMNAHHPPSAELAKAFKFPPFLARAAANIQSAYAQVVNHQNKMAFVACYCGCGPGNGHRSLKDCFIAGTNPDGSIAYGQHALN